MNTRFILPATFALTVLVFVLFGLSGKSPVVVPPPEDAGKAAPAPTIGIEPDDPIPATDEIDPSSARDKAENAVTRLPEIPVVNPPPGVITIPVIPAIRGDREATTIPIGWTIPRADKNASPEVSSLIDLDRVPRARLQLAPVYPPEMRKNRVEGTVVVDFLVDRAGNVYDAAVLSATTPGFEEAALRAVAKWKFEPGYRSGRRVRFRMSVPLVFRMADE
jgi:protein TonB